MAIHGKVQSESTFKPVSQGLHQAICAMVVDMGIQPGSDMYPKPKHKIYIGWDCLDEIVEWEKDGKKHSGPARIGREFTLNLGDTSNLRPFLESWRGMNFTDEQAEAFDIGKLMGAACQITVVHKQKRQGKGVRADVKTAVPWPKGMAKPAVPESAVMYDLTNPDPKSYDMLPQWIREKIDSRLADNELEMRDGKGDDVPGGIPDAPPFSDDSPF